ncbi:hypothetical protein CFE70_002468 [Pyrenophora teres f. teres 0-1]
MPLVENRCSTGSDREQTDQSAEIATCLRTTQRPVAMNVPFNNLMHVEMWCARVVPFPLGRAIEVPGAGVCRPSARSGLVQQHNRLDSATTIGRSFLQHEKPPQPSTTNLPNGY